MKYVALFLLCAACQTHTPAQPEFVSVNVPARTKSTRAPVLVLMHGVGSNERDLLGLTSGLDPRFQIISLRAPLTLGQDRFGWYPVTFTAEGPTHDPLEAERSRQKLVRFFTELKTRPDVDPRHVFVLGFSQGAIMGLALALTEPDLISGVVACSGRVLPELKAHAGSKKPALFLTHGTRDSVIPFALATQGVEALRRAGLEPEFHEYDAAHEINAQMRDQLGRWLTAQLE